MTKEDFLKETLRTILECATRRYHNADDKYLLENDLERIEQLTQRGLNILKSKEVEYTDYEIRKIHLAEFSETIEKEARKQKSKPL